MPNAQCPIPKKKGERHPPNRSRSPHALPNGAVDTYTYDALNGVLTHTAQRGGTVIYSSIFFLRAMR